MSCASVLTVWTETCQPAAFARPIVSVSSPGSQWKIVPQPLSSVIFSPWTRSRSPTGPGLRSVYQSPRCAPLGAGSFSARYASTRSGSASSAARVVSSSSLSGFTHCSEIEVQPRRSAASMASAADPTP